MLRCCKCIYCVCRIRNGVGSRITKLVFICFSQGLSQSWIFSPMLLLSSRTYVSAAVEAKRSVSIQILSVGVICVSNCQLGSWMLPTHCNYRNEGIAKLSSYECIGRNYQLLMRNQEKNSVISVPVKSDWMRGEFCVLVSRSIDLVIISLPVRS